MKPKVEIEREIEILEEHIKCDYKDNCKNCDISRAKALALAWVLEE